MRSKACFAPVLAAFFLAVALPAHSQVAPAAIKSSNPFSVGGGLSDFLLDWGNAVKKMGPTGWFEYRLSHMPRYLDGLSIEGQIRDIDFNGPANIHPMRQTTYLGGVLYHWQRYPRFQPYGKFLLGIGAIDFPPVGTYTHDTRSVLAPGAGVDYRFTPRLSVRADYEYQFWHALLGPHDLTPNGVTVGIMYHFGVPRTRY